MTSVCPFMRAASAATRSQSALYLALRYMGSLTIHSTLMRWSSSVTQPSCFSLGRYGVVATWSIGYSNILAERSGGLKRWSLRSIAALERRLIRHRKNSMIQKCGWPIDEPSEMHLSACLGK
jgi:hypothetical protein